MFILKHNSYGITRCAGPWRSVLPASGGTCRNHFYRVVQVICFVKLQRLLVRISEGDSNEHYYW